MKKFIISSGVLKPALNKLGQAVNANSVLPITRNILCKVGKDEVELLATDMEITISYKCPAETGGQDPFDLLIPFDFLNKIVKETKSAPMVIEHPSIRKAKIVSENDVYELNSLDKLEDYPNLHSTPKKFMMQLDADFVNLLSNAMHTCSKDELRPSMTRALMEIVPDNVYLVSTDAYAMYRHKINAVATETEKLQLSPKMAKALDGMNEVELNWTDKKVCLRGGNVTVWARRFDDTYPNYKAVIPDYEPTLELEKSLLLDVLHKACISSNQVKETKMILKKEKGFILFETNDVDYERKIHGKMPGEYSGNVEEVAINAKKLLTVLDQVKAEKIKLHIQFAEKAILVSTDEDKDYLGLIMPILPGKNG